MTKIKYLVRPYDSVSWQSTNNVLERILTKELGGELVTGNEIIGVYYLHKDNCMVWKDTGLITFFGDEKIIKDISIKINTSKLNEHQTVRIER